jgi:hypothetical protein
VSTPDPLSMLSFLLSQSLLFRAPLLSNNLRGRPTNPGAPGTVPIQTQMGVDSVESSGVTG